jgi:hypothetical protein
LLVSPGLCGVLAIVNFVGRVVEITFFFGDGGSDSGG